MLSKLFRTIVFMALLISLAGITTWLIFQIFMMKQPIPEGVTKVLGSLIIT